MNHDPNVVRPEDSFVIFESGRTRPLCGARTFLILAAPIPAILIGALVMRNAQVPPSLWMQNLFVAASMIIAGAGALFVPRIRQTTAVSGVVMGGALLVLAATLFDHGIQGVHRWLTVGSLKIHAGAICLPLLVIAGQNLLQHQRFALWDTLCFAVLGLLIAQPDAASATAFGAAFLVSINWGEASIRRSGTVGAGVGLFILCAWQRHDPLGRVPYVEDVVRLAMNQGWVWSACAVLALCLLPMPFLVPFCGHRAVGLAIYFTIISSAHLVGNFPVPLVGFGASPIIGYYMAAAWWAQKGRFAHTTRA